MTRLRSILPPVGLFVSALFVRLACWHSVFQSAGVHPNGYDAYYHLRRIRYSVEHFPDVLRFDPLINYPHGGQPIWSPAFDVSIAAVLRPIPGILQGDRLDRWVMWVPPLLGAVTVVLLFVLVRRFYSERSAILAGLALVFLPGHAIYSRLGNVDHHVLVALSATVMLFCAMALFRRQEARGRDETGIGLGLGAGLGAAMAAVVLVWPGALLHVGILQIGLVARLLTSANREQAWTRACEFAAAHGVAAMLVYPLAAGNEWVLWGSISPVVLTDFQPLYFLAGALVFGALGGLWRTGFLASSAGVRGITAAGLGAIVCAGLFAVLPDLLAGVQDALSWFSKDEEFQSLVSESEPLFWAQDGAWRGKLFLSAFVYATPLMMLFAGLRARTDPARQLLLGWAVAFFAASLVQWRFVNTYSIVHGILIAVTLDGLWEWAGGRSDLRPSSGEGGRGAWRFAVAGGLVAISILAFVPALRFYADDVENLARALRGETTRPTDTLHDAAFLTEAARFLKEHSPPIEEEPYSVVGPWGAGHVIKYVAERPVLQDNFGDDVAPENFDLVEAYFSSNDETEALALVAPVRARYVMVRPVGSGHSPGYARDSLLARLYVGRGAGRSTRAQRGRKMPSLSPLARHRLIYQSRPGRPRARQPFVMLFEIVEGAEIVGRAEPGARVRASLRVSPEHGTAFDYRQTGIADRDGLYRLRVPYSNQKQSSNLRVATEYQLRSGEHTSRLVVSEEAVLYGLRVDGPRWTDSGDQLVSGSRPTS